ncbi:MAG TPA: IPT/TIG domain-containing protein [Bryobacteraceae bacterium]|nr:IPT/TIG domain-containing protein [Bryobacteraceae bacterium]
MKWTIPAIFVLALGIADAQSYTYPQFDVPGSASTRPSGINNSGQIVGIYADSANILHGFLRSADGATFTTIDVPGALPGTTYANGINNLGQIVGSYRDANGYHAYIRGADGSFTSFEISNVGPGGGATAINDRGEIVGAVYDLGFVSQGFLRSADGSTFTPIYVPRFSEASPTAINNNGEIVGRGIIGGSNGTRHGFLCGSAGSCARFDLPGTDNLTQVSSVNNLGQFAGYGGTDYSLNVGFVSNADGTFALLGGYQVTAINDGGQITGLRADNSGQTTHGFVGVPGAASTQPTIRTLLPGVISASGFGGAQSIAPGTWIEIYGQNLAPATRQWRTSDFTGNTAPTSLDGVKVSINGSPAYVSYISPGQVNALVPATVTAGSAQVTVANGSQVSAPYTVTVNAIQPAMYVLPHDISQWEQYLGAVLPDFVTFLLPPSYGAAVPSRRAKPGDTIVLFGMGLGAVTPDVPAGQIAAQASTLLSPPEVFFDGTPGTVTYAGLVAGTVGLYQINVVVPNVAMVPGLTFNDYVSVSLQVNGVTLPPPDATPPTAFWLPVEQQ